jgi:hypothetical protein
MDRQQAHELLDQLGPAQFDAIVRLLEVMIRDEGDEELAVEDEEIGGEEEQAVARSKEWFQHHEGTPFEQVVAECGFTMDQIRNRRLDDERDPAA